MASSREGQQQTFPTAPPSLSAGDHETRDYYTPQDTSRPTINQAPYLTPYLGLRARLSQIWINRWTILLLLVLVRVLVAVASLDNNISSARSQALSSCAGVEAAGSAMASMPHYLSQGVNELTASGVEKAVNGLMSMLMLTVTGVEELVVFVINLMTSTYVCLITFAVSGSLHAAIDLVSNVTSFLNTTLGGIGGDLSSIASSFSNDLNKFISTLNSIPFVNNNIPHLDISSDVNKLQTLQLPSGLTDDLNTLNNSIPTFADVNNFTNSLIRLPFEQIKGLINDSLNTYTFNRSVFPVPAREQLSFCTGNQGIDNFFDELVKIEILAKKIFIVVILLLAIAACGPMAWWEIRRWRTMRERAALVNKKAFDSMDVVYIASRPYTSAIGIKIANKFRSVRHQTLVRWTVAYATSPPALFVLSLGIAGLFSCLCQFILLQAIKKEVPQLENQVSAFADKVVTALNNASEQWAIGTNKVITDTNNDINSNLLGWVNTSTTAVNNTLNSFVDGMNTELDKVFGGTPLDEPIKEVIGCLLTLKIVGIQKALTWVHDNAHINFPLLPNNTFSLGAAASITNDTSDDQFLSTPGSAAHDDISAAVTKLTNAIQSGIRTEAIISTCLVLIWLFVLLIGIFRFMMAMARPGKLRAEGGQSFFADPAAMDAREGAEQVPADHRESMAPTYEYAMISTDKGPSYTLNPRPFPRFDNSEKVGGVEARNPGVVQPAHQRSSSYGHVGGITPIDEKSSHNPFSDRYRG